MPQTDEEVQNLGNHFDIRLVADNEERGKVFLLRKKAAADAAEASAALTPFREDPNFSVREVLHDTEAGTKVMELTSLCRDICRAMTALSRQQDDDKRRGPLF